MIVFDGECVLCSRIFRFVLRHDRDRRFRFVLAQSSLGTAIYEALDLPTREFDTNVVIRDGLICLRGASLPHAMGGLPSPWSALSVLRHVPPVIADPAYHLIARNRYRIFGRFDQCMIPDAALRARFLPGGWT